MGHELNRIVLVSFFRLLKMCVLWPYLQIKSLINHVLNQFDSFLLLIDMTFFVSSGKTTRIVHILKIHFLFFFFISKQENFHSDNIQQLLVFVIVYTNDMFVFFKIILQQLK